jgi:cell division septation protein DedD
MRRRLTAAAFGWRPGWTARALALFRADDDRFTDEEILTILRAGEAGLKLADVCAAAGIEAVTYYDWKAKYNGLLPSGVRNRRLRARRKRWATIAALAALVVLSVCAAGPLVGMLNRSQSQNASANAPENPLQPRPTAPAATVTIPIPAQNRQSAAAAERTLQPPSVRQPAQGADAAQPVGLRESATSVNAEDIETAGPNGYVVQVAAVPNLQEARAVLEQLTEAGYPAHLTAKIVDRVELYRVRVGPLKSRPVAEEVARRLEREGHRAPWVTK